MRVGSAVRFTQMPLTHMSNTSSRHFKSIMWLNREVSSTTDVLAQFRVVNQIKSHRESVIFVILTKP